MHAYGLVDMVTECKSFDIEEVIRSFHPGIPTIAHTRYCQSGDWQVMENNQPIVAAGMVLAFNGCIHMGTKEEFEKDFDVKCETDNDGEIFLRKLEGINAENHVSVAEDWLGTIRGSFAGVWLAYGRLFVGRNSRRPLWVCDAHGGRWYASTQDIFKRAGFVDARPVEIGVQVG
jgi:glutamine phosphoribosylpyrophosphate amidotransferase